MTTPPNLLQRKPVSALIAVWGASIFIPLLLLILFRSTEILIPYRPFAIWIASLPITTLSALHGHKMLQGKFVSFYPLRTIFLSISTFAVSIILALWLIGKYSYFISIALYIFLLVISSIVFVISVVTIAPERNVYD